MSVKTEPKTRCVNATPHEAKALHQGRATAIVRRMEPQPELWQCDAPGMEDVGGLLWRGRAYECDVRPGVEDSCPFGRIGNVLEFREGYCTTSNLDHGWGTPLYKATFGGGIEPVCEGYTPWRSAVTMPREHIRTRRVIASIDVVRVAEMTREQALAIGCDGGFGPGYDFALHATKGLYESRHDDGSWATDWAWFVTLGKEDAR